MNEALTYLGYVLRRSSQSAPILRGEFGEVADAFEARYQADIQDASDEAERDALNKWLWDMAPAWAWQQAEGE